MDVTIALQRAVRGFPLGSAALAARLGLSVTSLSHKVSPTYPNAHCSPEETLDIMQITGDHGALQAMAAELGYVILPSPELAHQEGDSAQALAAVVGRFGTFITEVAQDLADGRVTDNERGRIEAEAAQAIAAIDALLRLVQRLNVAGKPVEAGQTGEGAQGTLDKRPQSMTLVQGRNKRWARVA